MTRPAFSMPRNNLEQLRSEVRKRHAAATKKLSRLRSEKGIELGGTAVDPRRELAKIKNYTSAQLNTYLNELTTFTDRSTQFIPGAAGQILTSSQWREYKQLESKYNQLVAKHEKSVGSIFIPTSGMTVAQREATLHPDSVTAAGQTVNRPMAKVNRKASNIAGEAGLKKLIEQMRKKLSPGYVEEEIKKSRKQMGDMLKATGMTDLMKRANKLSDSQFNVLWNYTHFATAAAASYYAEQAKNINGEERWYSSVFEDYAKDIEELVDWAEKLPTNATKPGRNAPRKRR